MFDSEKSEPDRDGVRGRVVRLDRRWVVSSGSELPGPEELGGLCAV
jgi:hypothetical protein